MKSSEIMKKHENKLTLFKVVSCSYEGSLFGWNVEEDQAGEGLQSTLTFGFNCCPSSLRAVAISESGRYLACGGVDERIRIYSMRERKSVGEVSNQVGAITVLRFFGDSFLFSGSEVACAICLFIE